MAGTLPTSTTPGAPAGTTLPTTGTYGINYGRINEAYDTAAVGSGRTIAANSDQQINQLNQQVAQYGGEGATTGAYKNDVAGQIINRDVQISNARAGFKIQQEQETAAREQYVQNMIAEGTISAATGNLIRSRFDMNVQLQQQAYEQDLALLNRKGELDQQQSLQKGLGGLAGMALGAYINPLKGSRDSGTGDYAGTYSSYYGV